MLAVNSEGKHHFATLDGLRGIAALSVVILHWFEGLGYGAFGASWLAVDFFFMLSGFVVAYSYEERLKKGLAFGQFMILRIIRLHPMIILGAFFGLIRFQVKSYINSGAINSEYFISFITTILMIPETNVLSLFEQNKQEHFWLNAPLWSLFFEFFAYILFGLILYKLSKTTLSLIATVSFIVIYYWIKGSFGSRDILEDELVIHGYARVLFSFCIGIILYRLNSSLNYIGKKIPLHFLILLPIFFALPRNVMPWYFYLLGMLIIFPMSIAVGVQTILNGKIAKVSDILGGISYPIYAIHVPLLWGMSFAIKKLGFESPEQLVWFGLLTIPITIAISYISLKIYDEPMRRWLKKKLAS